MVGSKLIAKSVPTDVCYFLFSRLLTTFIYDLFQLYTDLYFTYLEINPLGKNSRFVFVKVTRMSVTATKVSVSWVVFFPYEHFNPCSQDKIL